MIVNLGYCTSRCDVPASRLEEYVSELSALLKQPPFGIELHHQKIGDDVLAQILRVEPCGSLFGDIPIVLEQNGVPGLSLFVLESDDRFAEAAKDAHSDAVWGCCCGKVALVYRNPEKAVIWHETLHLLGAEDCYDCSDPEANPGPTCDLVNCIMQYAPSDDHLLERPFLCRQNILRVRGQLAPG